MRCKVFKLKTLPKGEPAWNKPPWKEMISHGISHYMGEKPVHVPRAEVKIAYGNRAVFVMFQVADQYVRAVAKEHQDNVWEDSCVEFFFTPGPDSSKGYFNLEMNCGGILLFHFQPGKGRERIILPKKDCNRIKPFHSLPAVVEPEIKEPVTWTISYQIPLSLIMKYCDGALPGPGVEWRGNFYKCGDKTSHPHWLTWSPVDHPIPNFHLPRSFGILEFQ